jgi:hypothetical protein
MTRANGRIGESANGRLMLAAFFALVLTPLSAMGQSTRALIISGVSGEPRLAQQFENDANTLANALGKRFNANTVVLTEKSAPKSDKASITQALQTLAGSTKAGEQVLIVLIGHASVQGGDARYNIPGPDITAAELGSALAPLKGRNVAVVVATSSSGAFAEPLGGAARWVLTATKSGAQNEEVVFPVHFARALSEDVADLNKDGGVSLVEAFEYTKQEVARFYKSQNRIATENAILNGSGADAFVLRAGGSKATGDPALAKLYSEREVIDQQLNALRARKTSMQAAAYEAELEKLLIQLAQKDRQIRAAEKMN